MQISLNIIDILCLHIYVCVCVCVRSFNKKVNFAHGIGNRMV